MQKGDTRQTSEHHTQPPCPERERSEEAWEVQAAGGKGRAGLQSTPRSPTPPGPGAQGAGGYAASRKEVGREKANLEVKEASSQFLTLSFTN